MNTALLHADELAVIDHDGTVHTYTDVRYTLATAGLTTCTVIDPDTGAELVHHDILMTQTRKAAAAR